MTSSHIELLREMIQSIIGMMLRTIGEMMLSIILREHVEVLPYGIIRWTPLFI
jgi:hypothetical protein